jgi:hypothetical protein
MNRTNKKYFAIIALTSLLLSCNSKPKVISANADTPVSPSGIFSEENTVESNVNSDTGDFTDNLHTMVVSEVLPTEKYIYLKVQGDGKLFWIATGKQDVKVGETYFYRHPLLKTNFESKEYKRIFDTIYLVRNIVAKNHGNNTGNLEADFSEVIEYNTNATEEKVTIPTHTEEIVQHKGSVKIAEIVANPSAYEGKTVQISGKCVKVNPNIMNRNWIHLQDGSKDDYNLVITSDTFVPEGKIVTMKAQVSLNRDFGAGYSYDLILENGIIVE